MYQYPYGDTQQLNLDWLLEQWQETRDSIDGSLQAEIDRVEAAISDLLTARDQAVAAQTAAETAATSASGYAGTASAAASTATAQATAAAGSAALAGTHASNAQTSETNAGLQATAAGNSASSAATSATNARNSELAAAASSSAAAGNSLYAEGFAVGEQNGTPVSSGSPYYENNAKYYELASEGFAVGEQNGTPVSSGSPYYENNAKYYKEEAATLVASIPPDYTQLSNDVNDLKSRNDFTAATRVPTNDKITYYATTAANGIGNEAELFIEIPASTYAFRQLGCSGTAYDENGTTMQPGFAIPNLPIDFINDGCSVYIKVSAALKNMAFIVIATSKTQAQVSSVQGIIPFSQNIKGIRTITAAFNGNNISASIDTAFKVNKGTYIRNS